jgi:aminoglycoside 3-N-acetyltransferase I
MEIKKLNSNDVSSFIQLVEIFKEVFENDEVIASKQQLKKLLSNPDFLVFVVTLNNKVIGGLTIYVLQRYYHSKPIAYIYDVGIDSNYQGKGFGKALIEGVCDFCKKNGFEDAYLEAESIDIDAVNFYRKTRFSSEINATHFTYTFSNES